MRLKTGLSPFTGVERGCSDFTITGALISSRFADWLNVNNDVLRIGAWSEAATDSSDSVVFDLEAKTTRGRSDELFMKGNNQLDLVRRLLLSRIISRTPNSDRLANGMQAFWTWMSPCAPSTWRQSQPFARIQIRIS